MNPIKITLPYPLSANRYWASRTVKPKAGPAFVSTYVTTEAKAYKQHVATLALIAGIRKPITGRVAHRHEALSGTGRWTGRSGMRVDGASLGRHGAAASTWTTPTRCCSIR
jgi:hypothetical protein